MKKTFCIFLLVLFFTVGSNVFAQENEIAGIWRGSFTDANHGETGLSLIIYTEGNNFKGIFSFYNMPGRNNAGQGSYYVNVSYNPSTRTYAIRGHEWINRPANYNFTDLQGSIRGNIFSGSNFQLQSSQSQQ